MPHLHHLREEYTRFNLDEKQLLPNPIQQFNLWFEAYQKLKLKDANAMTLSTANKETGQPSARIVLLKEVDEKGFTFFTNYNSTKGQELISNNKGCLSFFWPVLERQIIIQGTITKTERQTNENYFHSRPRGSQIGAWVSNQSEKISSRTVLETNEKRMQSEFTTTAIIPCPPHWGGYLLNPSTIEFWQGRQNRLHDRLLYEKFNGQWQISRLSP